MKYGLPRQRPRMGQQLLAGIREALALPHRVVTGLTEVVSAPGIETKQELAPKIGDTSSTEKSQEISDRARQVIPAGTTSTLRAAGYRPSPRVMVRGYGSRIVDVDGNEYIDYLMAYGAQLLGHSYPPVVEAIERALKNGLIFGAPVELEVTVAEKLRKMIPSAEMTRFAVSGTEATMDAIRLARAVTGKDKIVKFEGQWHGGHDYGLVGYPPLEFAGLEIKPSKLPFSPGIPEDALKTVIVIPWNNTNVLDRIIKRYGTDIGAVITEPVMANAGVIPPEEGYLEHLRETAQNNDILLIFDEVITGFRMAPGGAQEYYKVTPDITCLSKALGGGMPIAAFCGKKEYMEAIGPRGVWHGGTYTGHPVCLAATLTVLNELDQHPEIYRRLFSLSERLATGLQNLLKKHGHKGIVQQVGPLFQVFFTEQAKVKNYREMLRANPQKYELFVNELLNRGVYAHPHHMERWTISASHSEVDIEETLRAADPALRDLTH